MLKLVKILSYLHLISVSFGSIPLAINTWKFQNATKIAWSVLKEANPDPNSILDAITLGCMSCQNDQCDHTVGFGGSPDENGETTLDAMIFDGNTMNMGAVGGLRRIKNAIEVARGILQYTDHSFLVGDLSTQFAKSFFRLPEESLQTNYSHNIWDQWKNNNCQPNFWKNVFPDSKSNCGPYKPINDVMPNRNSDNSISKNYNAGNHDTIGMIVINDHGHIVAGTSTNGANHKIPGRVGDSPIPGAGAYADSDVGAATATGDGDIMMIFLPSFLAVEQMRMGASPTRAARLAISRIAEKYPTFFGGIIAVNKKGVIGAACNGMEKFPYTFANKENDDTIVNYVACTNPNPN